MPRRQTRWGPQVRADAIGSPPAFQRRPHPGAGCSGQPIAAPQPAPAPARHPRRPGSCSSTSPKPTIRPPAFSEPRATASAGLVLASREPGSSGRIFWGVVLSLRARPVRGRTPGVVRGSEGAARPPIAGAAPEDPRGYAGVRGSIGTGSAHCARPARLATRPGPPRRLRGVAPGMEGGRWRAPRRNAAQASAPVRRAPRTLRTTPHEAAASATRRAKQPGSHRERRVPTAPSRCEHGSDARAFEERGARGRV